MILITPMKKSILLLPLLCLFFCCKSKRITKSTELEPKNRVNNTKLKTSKLEFYGPVKSVILSRYNIKDSSEDITHIKPNFVYSREFDTLGNNTRNSVIDQNKWMNYNTKNVFYANTKIASSKLLFNTTLTNYTYRYEYDGENLIESKEYDTSTDSLETITKYKYDSEKLKSTEHYVRQKDSLQMIRSTFFNSTGTVSEEIKYDSSKISERNIYDSIGRIIISYSGVYSRISKPINTMIYTYDSQGNVFTRLDNAYSFKYEYDSYGNETVRYRFDRDSFYCPTGDCIIEIQYHIYEYDKKENWITKTEFDRECIPLTIETRAIEYFEKDYIPVE